MEAALREPSQKLRAICARLRESTASKAASNGAPTEDAHTTLLRAAEAASQQVRAFYFLLQSSPPASDAAACAAELVEAVLKYESWARSVADAMAPVSRRLIGPPCQAVLQAICAIVEKAARGDEVRAPDVGKVQEASAALAELPVSPAAACARLLRESVALLSDAAEELREAVREAEGEEEGEEGEEGEEEAPEVLRTASITAPLERLVTSSAEVLALAAGAGLEGAAGDTVGLNMLVTCGQALSTQVDSLVCAAHEDDAAAIRGYAQSAGRVVRKLHAVMGERCGMGQHAPRLENESVFDEALERLAAACAAT